MAVHASNRRRLERAALIGVLAREVVNFTRYWRSTTFSSTVEPTIYLLAFGLGFGALVPRADGLDYVQFVGTGTVATAVLFSSVFPGMYETFIKGEFQRTYDAILAAPVDTEELVTAEALWIAARAGTYSCMPLVVSMAFGLHPSWGMLTVPFIGFVTGFGWALFGILVAAVFRLIENFNYIISIVVTPLFLTAGTYFPISALPKWAQMVANVNPLYHCVQLVRHAVFGFDGPVDLFHLGTIAVFDLTCWWLAVRRMERRLID
ncbi:ABC transporter permease [Nocardia sp. NPDC051570]|uniref:ABC transporter permease n=1 Tax=Nocardia sp. NPDC051570 TaxID=3364324 RepID=UPI0037B8C109